jgi:hypothetical protein
MEEEAAEWAPEAVSTLEKETNLLPLPGITPNFSVFKPVA